MIRLFSSLISTPHLGEIRMISLFSIRHPNYCPNNRDKSSTASHCRLQLSPQLSYSTVLSSHLVFAQRPMLGTEEYQWQYRMCRAIGERYPERNGTSC